MEQYYEQPILFERPNLRSWLDTRFQEAAKRLDMWDGDSLLETSDADSCRS